MTEQASLTSYNQQMAGAPGSTDGCGLYVIQSNSLDAYSITSAIDISRHACRGRSFSLTYDHFTLESTFLITAYQLGYLCCRARVGSGLGQARSDQSLGYRRRLGYRSAEHVPSDRSQHKMHSRLSLVPSILDQVRLGTRLD